MNWQRFQGLKVALLGFGQENRAILSDLLAVKAVVEVRDRQPIADLPSTVTSRCGEDYLTDLRRFDWAIKSPGLPWQTPELVEAMQLGLKVTTQTQLFFDWCPATIIGVTGTKGKGTTASLIEQLLKATTSAPVWLVGNFGVPALTQLPEIQSGDYVIYELSSFQLDRLTKSPQIAVVLPIGSDHLDHHQDEASYHQAKASIVRHQNSDDWAILAADSSVSRSLAQQTAAQIDYFSGYQPVSQGVGLADEWLAVFDRYQPVAKLLPTEAIPLLGDFYRQNVAAALAVTDCLGLSRSRAAQAVRQFKGLPHRMEPVAKLNRLTIVNDSYATVPEATAAALTSLAGRIFWLAGGSSKQANFAALAETAKALGERLVGVGLAGPEGQRIAVALKQAGYAGELYFIPQEQNFATALPRLLSLAQAARADYLLLSPAAASFDAFRNASDRGDQFRAAAQALESSS